MATITTFSTTADGYVIHAGAGLSWATIRNATTGISTSSASANSSTAHAAQLSAGDYSVFRSFFYFDLSGESGEAGSVSFFGYGYTNGDTGVSAQLGTQAATLANADYNAFSGSEYGHASSWTTSGYNEIAFNAQGISDTDDQIGSGTMKVCCREYNHDYLNVTPTTLHRNGVLYANNAINKPYLEIETSGGVADDTIFFSHNF